jgi:KinB signaling pathway activation protein
MTLVIGGLVTGLTGFIVRWDEFSELFQSAEILQLLSVFIWLVFVGMTFSVISQMGFFAYLTIHQFGLRMFRSVTLWNLVQLVIIAVVVFDLVYFRFKAFAGGKESIAPYIALAIFLLLVSVVTSYVKMKQSNKSTFVSALFFMVVVTILEWLPVLQVKKDSSWLYLMLFALLACNAFQILALPKYNARSEKEREVRLLRKNSTSSATTIKKVEPQKSTKK